MNKLYIVIAALALFLVWDKTLNNKEAVTIQSQTPTNTSSFGNCNTPSSRTIRSCSAMYSIYKKKYIMLKDYASVFPSKKIKTCTKEGIKHVKELAYDKAEEECDYKVIDFLADHTVGLACDHTYEHKRNFMFKNEYCNKYIK